MFNPVCESARALMARGITGPFETRKPGIPYPCMRGDIAKTAALTIAEPDRGPPVHFTPWRPYAPQSSSSLSPARESTEAATPAPIEEIA
jgi:hypothetical protein